MTHLVWTEALNTDIPEIDKQHKQLVSYINELDDAVAQNDRDAVNHVLEELIEYTVFHFDYEEQVMQEIEYRYFIPHKLTHKLFIRRVGEYKARFDNGEDIAQELYDVLVHWLLQHIKHEDQGYAVEIRKRNDAINEVEEPTSESTSQHNESSGIVSLFKRLFHI